MARRWIAYRSRRGGDVIPPRRPTRARVATALAASTLGAALAAYSGFAATHGYDLVALLGATGFVALVVGILTGARVLIPTALIILTLEYAGALLTQDVRAMLPAVLFATLFFLTAELAYWSLELRVRSAPEPGILASRFALVGGLGLGVFAGSSVLLLGVADSMAAEPSLLLQATGVGAAVAIAAAGLWLARHEADASRASFVARFVRASRG